MMKSVYVDAGQLTAIRIPAEVVDLLAADVRSPGAGVEVEPAGRYQPLTEYLALGVDSVATTFGEIEGVLGEPLAPSARKHLPYWYSSQNSLGKAIATAGFKARGVRTEAETVEFVRRL